MSLFRNIAQGALGGAVRDKTAGRGLLNAGLGLIAARIATRSLPGAALVGGGLLAKYFWDRHREKEAESGFTDEDAEMASARAGGETAMAGAVPPEPEPEMP